MKKIDLLIYYRNLVKNIQDSLVKIVGLAIGLACILVIFLFIQAELTFDRFHENAADIYRIEAEIEARGTTFGSPSVSPLVGKNIVTELPEVKEMTRLFTYSWKDEALIEYGDKRFFEKKMFLVDPSFFTFFSFKLIRGKSESVFNELNSVVLSESCAKRYFGADDPIGKILTLKNFGNTSLIVRGIVEDAPSTSHFSFDLLLPLEMGKNIYWKPFLNTWGNSSFYTYIKTREGISVANLENKINELIKLKYEGTYGVPKYSIMPLSKIHLYSKYSTELEKAGNVSHVIFALIIGVVIALISLSNFVNITIAQVVFRAKEVGVKKMLGAGRQQLFFQFINEAVLLAFISMVVAFIFIEILITPFAQLMGISINLYNAGIFTYVGLFIIVIIFGVMAGLFPALMYSTYKIIDVLKGRLWKVTKKLSARRLIMVSQFVIVAVLLVSTIIVYKQKDFLVNDPGFSIENVIVVPLKDYKLNKNYSAFRNGLQSNPLIEQVTSSSSLPMSVRGVHDVECEGNTETVQLTSLNVGFDFIELYKLEIVEGRSFSEMYSNDDKTAYIINQKAAKVLGWNQPIGKTINYSNKGLKLAEFEEGKVIGVVKDFYHSSKHDEIEPLIIKVYNDSRYVSIRFKDGHYQDVLAFIKSTFEEVNPGNDFSHFLAEQRYEELYQDENKMSAIFKYSTGIAVLIAVLGLFSLSNLEMRRKFKEIGIRKVFGADSATLVVQFLKQYGILVVIANIISIPIAWYVMDYWLSGFAYAISISGGVFVLTFLFTTLIAFLTVSGQALKASSKNPVETLKYE